MFKLFLVVLIAFVATAEPAPENVEERIVPLSSQMEISAPSPISQYVQGKTIESNS